MIHKIKILQSIEKMQFGKDEMWAFWTGIVFVSFKTL